MPSWKNPPTAPYEHESSSGGPDRSASGLPGAPSPSQHGYSSQGATYHPQHHHQHQCSQQQQHHRHHPQQQHPTHSQHMQASYAPYAQYYSSHQNVAAHAPASSMYGSQNTESSALYGPALHSDHASDAESSNQHDSRSDSMSSMGTSSHPDMTPGSGFVPQYHGYQSYGSYFNLGSSNPYHQPYPDTPMMQGQANYGMQPPMAGYGHYAYQGHPQAYGRSMAPVYVQGRPGWQPVHHPQQPPQGPPVMQQPYAWRPGGNMAASGGQAFIRPQHRTRPRSHNQGASSSSTEAPSPHRSNSRSSLPVRPPGAALAAAAPLAPLGQASPSSASLSEKSTSLHDPSVNGLAFVPSLRASSIKDGSTIPVGQADAQTAPIAPAGDVLASDDATTEGLQPKVPGRGLRPHYHPQQGPRSDFVLWCGNVPHDATVEELWDLFSRLPAENGGDAQPNFSGTGTFQISPFIYDAILDKDKASAPLDSAAGTDAHGVLSIFVIPRSNCAFVNYATGRHLEQAVQFFHGKPLRQKDPRCPKLVCRVRKKDDEAQAGVAGQRGRGVHVSWLNVQREAERERRRKAIADQPASGDKSTATPRRPAEPSIALCPGSASLSPQPDSSPGFDALDRSGLPHDSSSGSYCSSGSISFTSTNSSLFRHPAFKHRYFILKSLRQDELERSVQTGLWATQPHNEAVLDQAFRNSESVFLIFSVNESGEFYGYARMAGPINTRSDKQADEQASRSNLYYSTSATSPSVSTAPVAATEAERLRSDAGDQNALSDSTRHSLSPLPSRPTELAPPVSSPMPITPSKEEADALTYGLEEGIIASKGSILTLQSHTWPHTKRKDTVTSSSSSSGTLRDDQLAGLSQAAAMRPEVVADENGIRRLDMVSETSSLLSPSSGESSSLAPSDSASWTSLDSCFTEQAALRAVIHNLRLDERESRAQAHRLEEELKSASGETQTTTASSQEAETGLAGVPRAASSDSWGKPFKIDWIKSTPLSFHRVRKLRNPWRDNRQVKVSRDGTELEPLVGRQLLEEWDKAAAESFTSEKKGKKRSGDQNAVDTGAIVATDEDE